MASDCHRLKAYEESETILERAERMPEYDKGTGQRSPKLKIFSK